MKINDIFLIKKIAKKDIKKEKMQSIFIVGTILFTSLLLTIFTNGILFLLQSDSVNRKQDAQIYFLYSDTTESIKNSIMGIENVEWVAERKELGTLKQGDYELTTIFADENALGKHECISYSGTYSNTLNDIIIPEELLEVMGTNKVIGDLISLDLVGNGLKQNYKISGIYKQGEEIQKWKNYNIYVNKTTAVNLINDDTFMVESYVRLPYENIDVNNSIDIANSIVDQIGVEQILVYQNSFFPFGGRKEQLLNLIKKTWIVWCILLLLAYLSIYSIFSILVQGKIRIYGQFRTIGVTSKQLKSIIYMEQKLLSRPSILIGIILGDIIGFLSGMKTIDYVNMFITNGIIFILIDLIIKMAVRVPVKKAMQISPMECRRYLQQNIRNKSYRRHQKLTPEFLGKKNLMENRRKTVLIISSLFLCGFLTLLDATFLKSYDSEKMLRFHFYPHGDIQVEIAQYGKSSYKSGEGDWYQSRIQNTNNPLTKDLLEKIKKITGVKKVTEIHATEMHIARPDGWSEEESQPLLSEQEFETIVKECLIEGNPTYKEFIEKKGIFVIYDKDALVRVGEQCIVSVLKKDGNVEEIVSPVMGLFSQDKVLEYCQLVPHPRYLMAEECIKQVTGNTDTVYLYQINTEKDMEDNVMDILQTMLVNSNTLVVDSLRESGMSDQENIIALLRIVMVMVSVVFVFSIEHLMNVILSDFYNRQCEYGILKSIGMTTIQLRHMISVEMFGYVVIPMVINLIAGSGLVFLICQYVDERLHCINYSYPFAFVFIYFITMLSVTAILICLLTRSLEKKSITYQIRG
ncbi:MAG: ABC transporter permease [Clostridium sp.]|nr:ABC transporter permease [Clostridium sp.]